MDWLGDFVRFCLHSGYGGWVLLAIAGWAVLIVVLGVLTVLLKALGFAGDLGQSFKEGWQKNGRQDS